MKKLSKFFVKTVQELAKQSNCVSHKVGCLIIKDDRIISMGYNGTPAGFKNCSEVFTDYFDREEHHKWSLRYEIHAEMNALMYAAKNGIATQGATMICSLEPCDNCLKAIIQSGITTLYFLKKYDKKLPYDPDFKEYIESKLLIKEISI